MRRARQIGWHKPVAVLSLIICINLKFPRHIMVVGTLKIEFRLIDNRSLKGKRKVVRSMVDKVKSRFNVSIAEVGSNDKWQKIELGISTVGNDRRHVDSSLNHVFDFIDSLYLAQIVDSEMEIINL